MEFAVLLTRQLIAHVLADYYLQWPRMLQSKDTRHFQSGYLVLHGLLAGVLAWVFSFDRQFFPFAAVIAVTHFLADGLKAYLLGKGRLRKSAFFIDQLFHVLVIIAVTYAYVRHHEVKEVIPFHYLLWALVILINLKPANIWIGEIFKAYEIKIENGEKDDKELPNAGKLIGNTERLLVLIFIMTGQPEAIGFLLAAKSILRYGENKLPGKTEYVLAGTLLSFGIAIATGMAAVKWIKITD